MPKSSEGEKQLRTRIQTRLKKRGIFFWSVSDALIKGLPDVQGIWKGVPFHLEFKAVDGRLAPLQEKWLKDIARNGGGAFEVRAEVSEGVVPWNAKYRRMASSGQWASDYKIITSDDWLEKELSGIAN
jgi:hypothetical protein